MWPRASLGLRAWAAPDARSCKMPQGEACSHTSITRLFFRAKQGGPREGERTGREMHVFGFGARAPSDSREWVHAPGECKEHPVLEVPFS